MTSCFCRKVWLPVESTSRNTDSSQRVVVQDSSLCCQLASTASKCSPHLTPLLNAAASLLLSGRKHINCNKYSTVHHQSISLLSMSSSFPTTSSSIWWLVEIQTHQTTVGTLLKWPVTLSCVVTFDKYSADRSDSSYILTSPPCCLFLSPILLLTCCVDLFFMDTWAWLYTHGVLSSDTSQQYHTRWLCFSLWDTSFFAAWQWKLYPRRPQQMWCGRTGGWRRGSDQTTLSPSSTSTAMSFAPGTLL